MAARKRAKAKKLEDEARNWEQGAEGERRVGAILDRLPPSHVVFHDLRIPGSSANIDHLVIGPYGVFVVDSKKFTYPVTRGRGKGADRLWTGRSPIRLKSCLWEAAEVERLVGAPVRPTMCIIAPSLPEPVFDFDGVRICRTDRVLAEMAPFPTPEVQRVDVDEVRRRVSREFDAEPQIRDASQTSPQAARGVWGALSHDETRGKGVSMSHRSRLKKPLREQALVRLGIRAVPILALIALMPFIPAISGAAGAALSERLASSVESATNPPPATTSTASAPGAAAPTTATVAATPVLAGPSAVPLELSCPNPGMGWVVSFRWPGDLAEGAAAYSIRWQLDDGPIIRKDIGGWADPAEAPSAMRIPNGADQLFFTDYLDDSGRILASTQQTFAVADDC